MHRYVALNKSSFVVYEKIHSLLQYVWEIFENYNKSSVSIYGSYTMYHSDGNLYAIYNTK